MQKPAASQLRVPFHFVRTAGTSVVSAHQK